MSFHTNNKKCGLICVFRRILESEFFVDRTSTGMLTTCREGILRLSWLIRLKWSASGRLRNNSVRYCNELTVVLEYIWKMPLPLWIYFVRSLNTIFSLQTIFVSPFDSIHVQVKYRMEGNKVRHTSLYDGEAREVAHVKHVSDLISKVSQACNKRYNTDP